MRPKRKQTLAYRGGSISNERGTFTFIDTAGIRRQSKIGDQIEKYSVLRAHMAVERADVCLLMIDASVGITEQDEKIAGIAHEAGKACIIVVNKWDSIEKDNKTVNEYNDKIRTALAYTQVIIQTRERCSRHRSRFCKKSLFKQTASKCICGILRKILSGNALRFFEIHKVFLQNRAFFRVKFSRNLLLTICSSLALSGEFLLL